MTDRLHFFLIKMENSNFESAQKTAVENLISKAMQKILQNRKRMPSSALSTAERSKSPANEIFYSCFVTIRKKEFKATNNLLEISL